MLEKNKATKNHNGVQLGIYSTLGYTYKIPNIHLPIIDTVFVEIPFLTISWNKHRIRLTLHKIKYGLIYETNRFKTKVLNPNLLFHFS